MRFGTFLAPKQASSCFTQSLWWETKDFRHFHATYQASMSFTWHLHCWKRSFGTLTALQQACMCATGVNLSIGTFLDWNRPLRAPHDLYGSENGLTIIIFPAYKSSTSFTWHPRLWKMSFGLSCHINRCLKALYYLYGGEKWVFGSPQHWILPVWTPQELYGNENWVLGYSWHCNRPLRAPQHPYTVV